MASKDFKVRHGLTVSENVTIEGDLTLGGNTVSRVLDSDEVLSTIEGSSLDNVTLNTATLNGPIFGVDSDSPYFTQIRFNNSNMMKFNQVYYGGNHGTYFENGDYQKVAVIVPDGNSQNYQVSGRMTAQNASEVHTVYFSAALRSVTLPNLTWSIFYDEEYNNGKYIVPQLWTKQTSPAEFVFAFRTLATIYGNVTVDLEIIPRSSDLLDNVTVIDSDNSEQLSVDSGYDDSDMTLRTAKNQGNFIISGQTTINGQVVNTILDSDNVIDIINNNTTGLTDSDLQVVADLRNDIDSDSIKIQAIQLIVDDLNSGLDSDLSVIASIRTDLDSDFAAFNTRINTLESATDDTGFDSDQIVAIIGENPGSQTIETTVFTFTAPNNDSEFSGTDDNGSTLSYTTGKIQVYLNGILLTEDTDYTATDGSSISLISAPDSDDILSVVKFLGTVQAGFDSDQVVAIINENVVSGSVDSDVAAVAALRRDVDSDSTVIQSLQGDIDVLRSDVDSDSTVIQSNTSDIESLRSDLDSESGEISELRRDVDSDIADHDSEIATINSKINAGPLTNQAVKIGYDAANNHSMNNNNYSILIGAEAGEGISGSSNIGIGRATAGKSGAGLTGTSNIHIGASAGTSSTSGTRNTFIGESTGDNVNGSDNIAIGQNAMAPGVGLGWPTATGTDNIALGRQAGRGIATNTDNVLIGRDVGQARVGQGLNFKGNENVLIGKDAADFQNKGTVHGSNIVAIGRKAFVPDSDSSNLISLGDSEITRLVISGLTLDTADANDGQYLRWNDSTNGFDWVDAISADSDTVAIAALRRDADSDSTRIQAIATEIEALNVLVDSDLTVMARLRDDVDSDSLVIQTLRGDVDTLQNVTHLDSESVARVTDTQFTVGNNGASAYSFTGDGFPSSSDNPTLYLQRGHTYHFNVNASGHPFEIRLSNGGSAYSDGVTNNAAAVGRVVFTVPMDAPDKLVYQCTNHGSMVGNILVSKKGFDSEQIASMILENAGSGITDSDLKAIADLRNDVDSDSLKIQALQETVNQLRTEQDSDSANSGGQGGGAGFDSDQIVAIINENPSGGGGAGFDSDQVVAIIQENPGEQAIAVNVFTFTATGSLDSDFTGADDNGNTLSYAVNKVQVFLNGVLLTDGTDYTATDGSTITLDTAPDSDDVLSVVGYLGVQSDVLTIDRFEFKATQDQTSFSGADLNGTTLRYSTGKVQVYLNGILLLQNDDYYDSDGVTIRLDTGADSDDRLSVIKYLGNTQIGFDSDQVVAIVNENATSVDSDFVLSVEGVNAGFDSDQVVTIISENTTDTFLNEYIYEPSPGTTILSDSDISGNILSYTAGFVQVYVNGVLLQPTEDFTANNGTSVTLSVATDSEDVVSVYSYSGIKENLDIERYDFTATASQTVFSGNDDNSNYLNYTAGKVQVYINGILLKDALDYTATNGTSVNLVTGADSDDVLSVIKYMGTVQRPQDALTLVEGSDLTPTSTGTKGQVVHDSDYLYVCVATDTWIRSAVEVSW